MKFIVSTTTLLKKLQSLSGVLPSRSVIPILDYFLFDVSSGILTIYVTDLEVSMKDSTPVDAKEDGKVAVPAKMLIEYLKTSEEQPIVIDINKENYTINITSDKGKYKIPGENPIDFPKFQEVENKNSLTLDSGILALAINTASFCISTAEHRPEMTGLNLEMLPTEVNFVATDGNRLALFKKKNLTIAKEDSIILPRKGLNVLKNNLPEADIDVQISYDNKNAVFSFDSKQLICRLIDGRFPDYKNVIPAETPNKVTIGRKELLSSLKRINVFTEKTTHRVKFNIEGNLIQLSAQDIDLTSEANENISVEHDGEDILIAFNAQFLQDIIQVLDSDDIVLGMNKPNTPCIIKPTHLADDEEILMLVMPTIVNQDSF